MLHFSEIFILTEKRFRLINSLVISSVKTLFSRNYFSKERVRVHLCNFQTVECRPIKTVWKYFFFTKFHEIGFMRFSLNSRKIFYYYAAFFPISRKILDFYLLFSARWCWFLHAPIHIIWNGQPPHINWGWNSFKSDWRNAFERKFCSLQLWYFTHFSMGSSHWVWAKTPWHYEGILREKLISSGRKMKKFPHCVCFPEYQWLVKKWRSRKHWQNSTNFTYYGHGILHRRSCGKIVGKRGHRGSPIEIFEHAPPILEGQAPEVLQIEVGSRKVYNCRSSRSSRNSNESSPYLIPANYFLL